MIGIDILFVRDLFKTYNDAMRRVNWTITEGQHRALKQLSQDTGLSISELVRRALDSYIHTVGQDQTSSLSPIHSKEVDHDQPKG